MSNQISIAKYLGGSHLYGLNTPESDVDEREIFVNTSAANILGLNKFEQEVRNNKDEDVHKVEIRRFLELARKGNTQSIEVLFAKEESFEDLQPAMKHLRENWEKIVDSDRLFKVVSSFIHAQSFLIFDDKRKAEKGGKRSDKIEKYGYNPKAAVTSIRLAYQGIIFFREGNYPVEVQEPVRTTLMDMKLTPEKFSVEEVRTLVEDWDHHLKEVYDRTEVKTKFDEQFANRFLLTTYFPWIASEMLYKNPDGSYIKQ